MAPFASFLRRSIRKNENENQDEGGRGSKRRSHMWNILRRRSQRDLSANAGTISKSDGSTSTKLSAALVVDSNKPLPPPPANPEAEPEIPKRPPIRLDRIISPLTADQLGKLFYGAPEFHVHLGGSDAEFPLSTVKFPWNDELESQRLTDHTHIDHVAWKYSSTYTSGRISEENKFPVQVRERPNVLSLQGLEKGTIGFSAALELCISDTIQSSGVPGIETDPATRARFFEEHTRVRPLNELVLIRRLSEIGEFYHQGAQRPSNVELYTALFTGALYPPRRVIDPSDPYSLLVQIEELLYVLSSAAFFDFSAVEMRIRLGQMLWGVQESGEEGDMSVSGDFEDEPIEDKTWLLLQIWLSSELLMRLDLAMEKDGDVLPAEISLFNRRTTPAVNWGLLLARSWLHNIKVNIPADNPFPEKKQDSWLSSLWARRDSDDDQESLLSQRNIFEWRHADLQRSGLLLFAQRIKWGNVEGLESRCLKTNEELGGSPAAKTSNSPGTPASTDTRRSYFSVSRPNLRRNISTQQKLRAVIRPAGWISRSYFSGVILPGESMSHLLMATLLENDGEAMGILGEETTLYGGFIYAQRSYWSLFCVVGRILAAEADAAECMGWVSSSIIPEGLSDRWVDIEVQDVVETSAQARIWQSEAIEKDSRVTGDGDYASTFASDFVFVQDLPANDGLDVRNPKLLLSMRTDSTLTTPTIQTPRSPGLSDYTEPFRIQNYTAQISFDVILGEPGVDQNTSATSIAKDWFTLTLFLIYDVRFVAAAPCIAPTDIGSILPLASGKHIGHPLHKIYTYSHQPLSSIIQSQLRGEVRAAQSDTEAVLIIDCTNQIDSNTQGPKENLDVLARAYCSENGFNALISRKGRSCLSCSVREARALDFHVIIRVGT